MQPSTAETRLQEEKEIFQNKLREIQQQLQVTSEQHKQLIDTTENQRTFQQGKWHKHKATLNSALKELANFRIATNKIRSEAAEQIQGIFIQMNSYKDELENRRVPVQTEIDRATELAKLEAFDHWIEGKTST